MKKIALVVAITFCLFTLPAIAAENFTTTFKWSQANAADLALIKEWKCEEVASGQVVTFPNTGGTGPFQADKVFTLSGAPGASVVHNYRIKAVALNGTSETAWSNTKSKTYVLTGAQIGVPVLISVE